MNIPAPHFFLVSQASQEKERGEWSFALQAADGSALIEANDTEPDARGERLELLAVVRGLEALDQPSRVTLVTPSRYVKRGICYGLQEWCRNGWNWERFGEMVPVKNRDLWQRLDRALKIHRIDGRMYRLDGPHGGSATRDAESGPRSKTASRRAWGGWRGKFTACRRWLAERPGRWRLAFAQLGTRLLPYPWLE